MILSARQRQLLQALWPAGPLSRSDLHERTRMRLNTIGDETAVLIEAGILRVEATASDGPGRPRVPLGIDPAGRHVMGLALRPGRAQLARLNLVGQPVGPSVQRRAAPGAPTIRAAARLLREHLDERALAVGLTAPGFIDAEAHRLLFSAAVPGGRGASLQPIYDTAGECPIALANDAHALAARWAIEHPREHTADAEDALVVLVDDGQVGASLLIGGRPNRGSVLGGNEIGHMRLPVQTPPCFCGGVGCLEMIFSSRQLASALGSSETEDELLAGQLDAFDPASEAPVQELVRMLALGLANAVNFTRVGRLVLAGPLFGSSAFTTALEQAIRRDTLGQLERRLTVDFWHRPPLSLASSAADLVLAHLFCPHWESLITVGGRLQASA